MEVKETDAKIEGEFITIRMKMNPNPKPSSTGKSLIVASTGGYLPLEGSDIKFSVNVIKCRN